jgi:hypothetical protein
VQCVPRRCCFIPHSRGLTSLKVGGGVADPLTFGAPATAPKAACHPHSDFLLTHPPQPGGPWLTLD